MRQINYRIYDLKEDIDAHPNQIEKLTLDKINDLILDGIYKRNCKDCFNEKKCHDDCTRCDEMNEFLESIGFEV